MIITLSGTPGSGKSTLAKILARKLKAKRLYVGGMRRELAREKKMTLIELNEYAKAHPETDLEIDKKAAQKAKELEKQGKIVIAEGYVQYHFLPQSIKLYLKVDPNEGARRIWQDLQKKETRKARNEGNITSFEQMKRRMKERLTEDAARYRKYYGIDHRDESQYDFVLDTTKLTIKEVAGKVIFFLKKRQQSL